MSLQAAALEVSLRIPLSSSLKDKRAAIRPIVDGARRRFEVAAAEVDELDVPDRSVLAFAAVAGTVGHVDDVLDRVDRFVWSFPEIEVIDAHRWWVDRS